MKNSMARFILSTLLTLPLAAHAAFGDLDSTFGDGKGWVNFNGFRSYANYHDVPIASFIRSDGKLIVVGSSSNASVAISRLNTDGTLDTSFNTTGSLSIAASGSIVGSGAIAATLLPDDKIVVLIPVRNESGYKNIGLLKLNEDGSIDTSFGNVGISMMPYSGGVDEIQCQGSTMFIRQSDGKFVSACRSNPIGGPDQMYLVRFNDDGTLDTSFDSDGVVNSTLQSNGFGNFIQQSDGKLVAVGQKPNGPYNQQGLHTAVRFNVDGSLDTVFNSAADSALSGSFVYGAAITQQNDGRLVILGNAMIRLNINGSRDTSFSGDGIVPFASGNSVVEDAAHNLVTVGFTADNCYTQPPCPFNIRLTRVLPNGNLDTSFGVGGVIAMAGYTHFWAGLLPSLVLQTDGKWVMTTTQANDANFTNDYDIRRFNSDGSVDTAFGVAGVVNINFGGYGDSTDAVATTALQQQDGKLVAAGWLYDANSIKQFGLVRYNFNGSLDTTFNGSGSAVTTFDDRNSYGSVLTDLIQQADGKLVAIGWTQTGTALARYNTDGSPDASFNGDGKVITRDGLSGDIPADIGVGATPYSVMQQSDGKLVLGGTTYKEDGIYQMLLTRYNADGSLDTSFNGTGFVRTESEGGVNGAGSAVNSVIQQSDGKLVAVGYASGAACSVVARYLDDGSLDTSFNSQGVVCTSIGVSGSAANRAIQQSDGKLIVGGNGGTTIQLARYNSDGSLDANFGIQGVIETADMGGYYSVEVRHMYLKNNNKIMIVASATDPDTGYKIALLARFNINGTVDEDFDANGVHVIKFGEALGVSAVNTVFMQADGKLVAAGAATNIATQARSNMVAGMAFSRVSVASEVAGAQSNSTISIAGDSMFVARFSIGTRDKDKDGVKNSTDNCPENANTNQRDIDGDGMGDVCDNDIDGDGARNRQDKYPHNAARW